jgi:hypothetical protein
MTRTPLAALALALAASAHAQTPGNPSAGGRPQVPQILVLTAQGQTMALTPVPAPPEAQSNRLRVFVEQEQGRVVVVRRAPQPPLAFTGGGQLEIEPMSAFEPGYEEQRLLGIRLVVKRPELPEPEQTYYLELHEVDPLLEAIRAVEEVIATPPSGNETDVEYHGLEGFGVGYRTVAGGGERYVRAGRRTIVRAPLAADGLLRLRDGLERARTALFGG